MARHDDVDAHCDAALDDRIKVVDFEPQKHAVAVGLVIPIADWAVIMLDFEAVQLQDKATARGRHQPLILGAAVIAPATEQALIPAAAGFDIGYRKQRLGTHDRVIVALAGGRDGARR